MASLRLSYETGTVPHISVHLETGSGFKRVIGAIDTGSVRSLCPLQYTGDLGISDSDLVENDIPGTPAVGPDFPTYSANVAVTGQIIIPSPEENDFLSWGKLFRMDLVFAETDTLLLGQSDFFRCFDVKFLNVLRTRGRPLS